MRVLRKKENHLVHRIHKWRTRGKKLVPSHESEALEDKQKLQMKTFSQGAYVIPWEFYGESKPPTYLC